MEEDWQARDESVEAKLHSAMAFLKIAFAQLSEAVTAMRSEVATSQSNATDADIVEMLKEIQQKGGE